MPITAHKNRFLLLYGSQTGQAKAIAEEIAEKAEAENLHPDLFCLSQTEKKFYLEREHCVVIVTSTTGDGEPPDTALKFVRRLKKKTLEKNHLSQLNYAILGLGDSNYTNFCNCAKTLDKRLQELGAKHFYTPGWADDAVGLEVVVEPWMDGLPAAVKNFLNKETAESHCETDREEPLPALNGSQKVIEDTISACHENGGNSNVTQVKENKSDVVDSNVATDRTSDNIENCDTNADNKPRIINQPNTESSSATEQGDTINRSYNNSLPSSSSSSSSSSDTKHAETLISNSNQNSTDSSVTEVNDSSVVKEVTEASVRLSLPPLCESTLTVPALPPAYLTTDFDENKILKDFSDSPLQNGCTFPSAASPVAMATVVSMTTLTSPSAVKKAMSVTLDVTDTHISYTPGDSFSLICPNHVAEVDALLSRLNILDKADQQCSIQVIAGTKKRNASVPKHIPEVSSLRHIFTTCLDIREPPKKALLRALVECTSDQSEQRRLQELCSKQGAEDYSRFIREPGLSILDILQHFLSCDLSVERLLEHLPRLQPRPYSVCSSPLSSPGQVEFVFNIMDISSTHGRTYSRKGVCTGWLERLSGEITAKGDNLDSVVDQMANLNISGDLKVPVFSRTNQHFHLPDDSSIPLILIGPGTGVAPFLGFLDQRVALKGDNCDVDFGDIWLFYGCRHKDRDYLFRDRLDKHVSESTLTKLLVSFSRDDQSETAPRYVQDNIRTHGQALVNLLEERNAVVYVCGDAKNMAKDVNQAFIDIFSKEKGISEEDARKVVMKLRLVKRYLEDVWT